MQCAIKAVLSHPSATAGLPYKTLLSFYASGVHEKHFTVRNFNLGNGFLCDIVDVDNACDPVNRRELALMALSILWCYKCSAVFVKPVLSLCLCFGSFRRCVNCTAELRTSAPEVELSAFAM